MGVEGDIADFIEEDRSAVGRFKDSFVGGDGAGERPFDVAKEGGFEEVGGEAARVDSDEGLFGAGGIGMNRLGDEFFAGAGFAGDEDGGAGGRDLGDKVEHLEHPLAFADNIGERIALLEGAFEFDVFTFEVALTDLAFDFDKQFLVVPGLGEVVVGARLEGADGDVDGAVGGDQEDGRSAVALADFGQDFEARLIGHHEVEQDEVVGRFLHAAEACISEGGEFDDVAFEGE